jgi:hypothetical protein
MKFGTVFVEKYILTIHTNFGLVHLMLRTDLPEGVKVTFM